MADERKIVAGIVGLGFHGYSGDCVGQITSRVAADLEKSGKFELRRIPEIQNYRQGQRAIEAFCPLGCDVLILVAASWLDARGVIPFLIANRQLPVLLYSTGGRTGSDGVMLSPASCAGTPAILEPMRSLGIRFEYIFEEPDQDTKVDDIVGFCGAARAVADLKNTAVGSMGFADMGLYTTSFDNSLLRNIYGIRTEYFDMLEAENAAARANAADVDELVADLKDQWEFIGRVPRDETLRRVAALTLGIRTIIDEKKLDAFSLKCPEGMLAHMNCAPCMIGTLLGDECLYICECDVLGMLGHVILNRLTRQTATFWESYEFWHDRILFGVCGFIPPSMIEGPRLAKLFGDQEWEALMNTSGMKTGRATLIRPFFRNGKPLMHMVTGEALEARRWLEVGFEEPGMHPSVELILDGTIEHFIDNVPAQHFSIVYGDWAKQVGRLCKLLDVELIYEQS